MDTTKTITHLGLCAGYGGIELGLKRVLPALRTVALCEVEAFAIANLVTKMETGLMDPAPIWTNLKTFPWESFRDRVDILTGGYPCQPFSAAGKRAGDEDPRHLWPYIADGIQLLKPRVCFFENVEGHISLGLSSVISDLEEMGYKVSWGIFSAAEVGAPHQRKRVFILANRNNARLEGLRECGASQGRQAQVRHTGGCCDVWPSRPGESQHAWEPPRVVEHANSDGRKRNVAANTAKQDSNRQDDGVFGQTDSMGNTALLNGSRQTTGQRKTQIGRANTTWDDKQTQPALGGDVNGPAGGLDYAELCVTCDNRTDELRLLGNGVVPATAALAYLTLMKQIGKWEEAE